VTTSRIAANHKKIALSAYAKKKGRKKEKITDPRILFEQFIVNEVHLVNKPWDITKDAYRLRIFRRNIDHKSRIDGLKQNRQGKHNGREIC